MSRTNYITTKEPKATEGKLVKARVVYVYDGDTFYIESDDPIFSQLIPENPDYFKDKYKNYVDGVTFSIRLANINCPEIKRDKETNEYIPLECELGGIEAAEFTKKLLEGKDVILDVRTTQSGTLLVGEYERPIVIAYVPVKDLYDKNISHYININKSLLKNGLAKTYFLSSSNMNQKERNQWKNIKPDRYDKEKLDKVLKELTDDRDKVLGPFDPEHQMRLGDVQFRIPPTQIQVTRINESSPVSVIRNNTKLQGSTGHSIKQIQLELYFNGIDDINGVPAKSITTPSKIIRNGDEVIPVYYVNGLRQLIAQFKVTPFLPVDNNYLNIEHDISAVTLQNLVIQNIPNYPDVIKATLTLLEFNWLAYIDVDPIHNFSEIFNWPLFRFYYQRLLEGTGMQHTGTQIPFLNDDINAHDFWFSIATADVLQAKEDYLQLLSTLQPEYALDYTRPDSNNEMKVHDAKVVQAAQKHYELYINEFLDRVRTSSYQQLIKLREEYYKKCQNITNEIFDNKYDVEDVINSNLIFFKPIVLSSKYGEYSFFGDDYYYDPEKHGEPIFELRLFYPSNIEMIYKRYNNWLLKKENKTALNNYYNNRYTEDAPEWFKRFDVFKGKSDFYDVKEFNKFQEFAKNFTYNYDKSHLCAVPANFKLIIDNILDRGTKQEKIRQQVTEMAETFQHELEHEVKTFNDLILQDIAVSLSNKVNAIKIDMQKAPTHQYLGSEDIVINLSFITTNKEIVEELNDLFDYVKALELRYENILDMPILNFHNDLTDLFDLDGVILMDMVDSTVKGYPGVYQINISLIGFRKEEDGFESLNKIHQGTTTTRINDDPDMTDYFALKEKMRYINLYPDLEVPRYSELPVDSYIYDATDDTFVDPDFYCYTAQTTFIEKLASVLASTDPEVIGIRDFENNIAEVEIKQKTAEIQTKLQISNAENTENSNTEIIKNNSSEKNDEYSIRDTRGSKSDFLDSCIDMLKYDKKGRLIRAFPTYYLTLIDEGNRIWWWRIYDNFYEYNGVKSIDVVKSRKQAADTCMITLSNSRGNLSNAETKYKKNKVEYKLIDALWKMTPWEQVEEQKLARSATPTNVQLNTGARIHLRMGYGSSPESLPTVFNGIITELELGEEIIFVAQGDGIELTNPIPAKPSETFLAEKEPAHLMIDFLQQKSWWDNFLYWASDGALKGEHPLGIEHFGKTTKPKFWEENDYFINKYQDLKYYNFHEAMALLDAWRYLGVRQIQMAYYEIFNKSDANDQYRSKNTAKYAEISQNIHPASEKLILPIEEEEDMFGYSDLKFNIYLYGKTPWDIFQTCAMAAPNYICSVHPFGFRSTIFYGHPNWELAYDYDVIRDSNGKIPRDENGKVPAAKIIELTKPFRQLHLYTSFDDIIDNKIKATDQKMYNVVQPVMGSPSTMEPGEQLQHVYVDTDIWPNQQKVIKIDTSVKAHSGARGFDEKYLPWVKETDELVAYRIAQSALKDYVKEMYQGYLLVVGDPTVKPYDYCYLYDLARHMNGVFEVEQVVHTLNKHVGFVTSITPDPLVTINEGIDEDYEFWMWSKNLFNNYSPLLVVGSFMMTYTIGALGIYGLNKWIKKSYLSSLNRIRNSATLKKVSEPVSEVVQKIYDNFKYEKVKTAINNLEYAKIQKIAQKGINKTDTLVELLHDVKKGFDVAKKQGLRIGNRIEIISELKALTKSLKSRELIRYADDAGRAVAKVDDAIDLLGIPGKIAYYAGRYGDDIGKLLLGIIGSPYIFVAELLLEYIALPNLLAFLREKREFRQCLTILPLTKDGLEFSAGIDGHRGAVLGDDPSAWDTFWNSKIMDLFLGEKNAIQEYSRVFAEYQEKVNQQIQQKILEKYNDSLIGRDIVEYEGPYGSMGSNYQTPEEEIKSISAENRSLWNHLAYERSKNKGFTLKEYKGLPLHEYLIDKLKEIETEYGEDLELSTEMLPFTDDNTNLLYKSGLAVRIKTDLEDDFMKDTIYQIAYITGFKNHGLAKGNDFIHLDLGLPKQWEISH